MSLRLLISSGWAALLFFLAVCVFALLAAFLAKVRWVGFEKSVDDAARNHGGEDPQSGRAAAAAGAATLLDS